MFDEQLDLFGELPTSPQGGEKHLLALKQLCDDLLKHRLDIEKALCYGRNSHNFEHVVDEVMKGRLHFYPLENSFIIMEVHVYPNYSVYHGFLAGGDLEEILNAHPMIMANAKQLGCVALSISGRRGWEKAMKAYGWKHDLSYMYKEL